MSDYVGEALHMFSAQGISLFLLATGRIQKDLDVREDAWIQRDLYTERGKLFRETSATSNS